MKITKPKPVLLIAALILTGIVVAAGVKCIHCNGTGWRGNFKCAYCGGDGIVGN